MNNKVKFIKLLSLVCVLGLMTFSIQSCKDDDKPPVVTNDDDNTNPDPLAGKDYLKFEGVRVEFRNPEMAEMNHQNTDTSLEWRGNKPVDINGDTVLHIAHPGFDNELNVLSRKVGKYDFVIGRSGEDGKIGAYIRWGTLDGKPYVRIIGGDYELMRKDGKWVSILKNGKGAWIKSAGDTTFFSGIEFKATWPN